MWLVAKIKKKEFQLFKKSLHEKIKDVEIYAPKYECSTKAKNRKIIKFILNSYVFTNTANFEEDSCVNKLRYIKGLEYILGGYMEKDTQLCKVIYKKF